MRPRPLRWPEVREEALAALSSSASLAQRWGCAGHSRGHIPLHKPGMIRRRIWGHVGDDPPPEHGDFPVLGTVAITSDSRGFQSVLCDSNWPKLSQSLAWHLLCVWVGFLINQEKRGSKPRLFQKVGFAIPSSPRLTLLHSLASLCCSGTKQQTALKTFASLLKPFCFKEMSCRPFSAAHRMTRHRRSPQTILFVESPATQPPSNQRGRNHPWPCSWLHWNHSGESHISISKECKG